MAWEENWNDMQRAIEEESKRSAERRAALTPRRRLRANLEHAVAERNIRRGTRGHAATRAANRATSAARRRVLANYISRKPNFRSLAALRATERRPFENRLPANVVSHIGEMLYGPRARGEGQVLAEMARRGRQARIEAATRRHFPNLGLPRPKRTQSEQTRRKRSAK